jgi:hypothetical protein
VIARGIALRGKKGFADLGLVLAVLLLIGITVIVGYKIFSSYNEKWQANDSVPAAAKIEVQDLKDRYVGLFDGIFMFIFALLVIALFISVAMIGTRPEFFFITIFIMVIFIGVSALLSNVYEDTATSTQLNNTTSEFTFIPFIMGELPKLTLLMGAIILIGLYVKIRGIV